MELTDVELEIIQAMADLSLNVTAVSKRVYKHRNTVLFHLRRIRKKTGLDPRKFYDLAELLKGLEAG